MKSEVCRTSPLFLLDLKGQEWPTLPGSKNKSFNELYTIGSETLTRVFFAVNNKIENATELLTFLEELRVKRNQIVHALHPEHLTNEYLVQLQFKAARFFFDQNFWDLIREEEQKNPIAQSDSEIFTVRLHTDMIF